MNLGSVMDGVARCSLCGWSVRCPDPIKELIEHLQLVHKRRWLDREDRRARGSDKVSVVLTGPRFKNDLAG